MRHFLTTGLFIAIIISCNSKFSERTKAKKEFEGTITYKTILESKTPNISTENLQRLYGDTMTIYLKNGNYRMTFNGTDIKEIYYIGGMNNQYTIRKGIDTLFINSCDIESTQLVSSEIQKETEKIINRQCIELINNLGNTKNYYWFDSTIYINPDNFKKHQFGYVNTYYEIAKSPWVKYKYEGRSFNLIHTAIEIKSSTINDKIFQLPNLPESKLE